jgi:hypothetical protein
VSTISGRAGSQDEQDQCQEGQGNLDVLAVNLAAQLDEFCERVFHLAPLWNEFPSILQSGRLQKWHQDMRGDQQEESRLYTDITPPFAGQWHSIPKRWFNIMGMKVDEMGR